MGLSQTVDEDALFLEIAKRHFPSVETLETRNRDALDFHDVSVQSIKAALKAAYEAGKAAKPKSTPRKKKGPLDDLIKLGDRFQVLSDQVPPAAPNKIGAIGTVVVLRQPPDGPAFCIMTFEGQKHFSNVFVKDLINVTLFRRLPKE